MWTAKVLINLSHLNLIRAVCLSVCYLYSIQLVYEWKYPRSDCANAKANPIHIYMYAIKILFYDIVFLSSLYTSNVIVIADLLIALYHPHHLPRKLWGCTVFTLSVQVSVHPSVHYVLVSELGVSNKHCLLTSLILSGTKVRFKSSTFYTANEQVTYEIRKSKYLIDKLADKPKKIYFRPYELMEDTQTLKKTNICIQRPCTE